MSFIQQKSPEPMGLLPGCLWRAIYRRQLQGSDISDVHSE
jgi:hypothetical protein